MFNVNVENDETAVQVPHNGYYFVILNNWVSSYQFPLVKDSHRRVQPIEVKQVRTGSVQGRRVVAMILAKVAIWAQYSR